MFALASESLFFMHCREEPNSVAAVAPNDATAKTACLDQVLSFSVPLSPNAVRRRNPSTIPQSGKPIWN
jgi:hypothetical protein